MKLNTLAVLFAGGSLLGLLQAQDTVIGFDDSSVTNKEISTFYHAKGVDFLNTNLAGATIPLPVAIPATGANSAPNVASIRGVCGGEFCTNAITGKFTNSTTHIRIFVGDYGPNTETATVTLSGFNAAQKMVATGSVTVTGGAGFHTALDISLPIFATTSDVMVYFQVTANLNARVGIDDLTFDPQTGTGAPDFALAWTGAGGLAVQLSRGGTNVATIRVNRAGSSVGNIALTAASGVPGVSVTSISPNPTKGPGPDGTELVTVTLLADGSAAPATGNVTITGTPVSSAGSAPRTAVISVTVRDSFDIRVVGIEVTQSVQSMDLPQKNAIGVSVPYSGGTLNNPVDITGLQCAEDLAAPGRTLQDRGVSLAETGKTIVRVFANVRVPPFASTLPPIEAALFVCDSTGAVCSPAINPDGGALTLVKGPNKVCDVQRADANAAYVFTLDNKLAKGKVNLKAQVFPPGFSSGLTECTDSECADNNTFVLAGVQFTRMIEIQIAPVELVAHCSFGSDPKGCIGVVHPAYAFAKAINIAPLAPGGLRVPDFQGSIEIGDLIDKDASDTDRASMVVSRLIDRAEDWNFFDTEQFVVGLYADTYDPVIRGTEHEPGRGIGAASAPCSKSLYCPEKVAIAIGAPRPYASAPTRSTTTRGLVSTGHELSHMFGRNHAGKACAGTGDSTDFWPPDDQGFLQGFGFNRMNGVYASLYPSPARYAPLAPGRSGPPYFYDLMSYCALEGTAWISVRGWNDTITMLHAPGAPGPEAAPDVPAQPAVQAVQNAVPVLLVRAIILSSGAVQITKVGPANAAATNDPPYADYHLVARSAAGAVLSDTQMSLAEGHPEPGVEAFYLSGRTTATSAASIEIQLNGNVVASRTRGATPPVVKIIAPVTGSTVGISTNTLVQWTTTAPSATGLMAKIDYSVNGGNTWKPMYFGPDAGQVSVLSSLFTTAQCGQARVRINDGFNETTAVSGCFTALGSPPSVRIVDPSEGTSFLNNATLSLSGEGYDENGKPLPDAQLTWTLGSTSLGTGRSVSATGFSSGTSRILLTGTDSRGRTATASLLLVCGNQNNRICTLQPDTQVTGPQFSNAGIGNAGSYESGAVSPGEIVTIFGSNLGPAQLVGLGVHNGVLDSVLDETAVLFDDVPAPLIYILNSQISAIVPYGVKSPGTVVQVVRKGVRSTAITIPVVPSVPGIFTTSSSGTGQGAILNEDLSVNSTARPAARGSIIAIYGTGEGQTDPGGVDGKLAVEVYPKPLLAVTATVGGQPATVLYAGAAPGLAAGVLQVNVRIPDGIPSGNAAVQLKVGSAVSRAGVTVAVQ